MQTIKSLWGKVRLPLFIIILCLGSAGWTTFYFLFPPMYQESQQVWKWYQTRQLNGIGEKVETPKNTDSVNPVNSEVKAVSFVPTPTDELQYVASRGGLQTSAPVGGVIETIYEVAKEKQFENPELLVRIASAESSLDPCARNPHSSATGLYQILDMHGLTIEERCNPRIATAWAIDHFGNGNPWNSSRSKWDL